nr:IS1595 family transposase [uncultured Rhodopila sp.]
MASVLDRPYFRDETAAYAKVESIIWPNGPVCVHCGEVNRIGLLKGKATRPGVYKCYACRKQFRATVGTIFESSHIPLHAWLQAVYLMVSSKKGVSSNQLHRTMGITLKSAWFMSHRIREAMRETHGVGSPKLGGEGMTIEADETYVGGKAANRAYGPIPPKQAVTALVERGGKVRSFHVPNVTSNNLYPIVARHTHMDSGFMTDDTSVYSAIGKTFKGGYETVNHSAKEYVRQDAYTNTVEGYFFILKRGVYGIYQHVSEAHLQRYLAEFDFRYSYRIKTGYDDTARMDKALAGIVGKRLTYRSVGGAWTAPATC